MNEIDSLTEFYVQENMQLLEQLEQILLMDRSDSEGLGKNEIEEIFRAMHTIKGSSGMMGYDSITKLTHSIEDVFDEIRGGRKISLDIWEDIIDVLLESIDFLKEEILNVSQGLLPEGSIDELHEKVLGLLNRSNDKDEFIVKNEDLKIEIPVKESHIAIDGNSQFEENHFCIKIMFEEGCLMEGIRALGVVTILEEICTIDKTIPEDLMGECDDAIVKDGFSIYIKTDKNKLEIEECIKETMFLKSLEINEIEPYCKDENKNELLEENILKEDSYKIKEVDDSGEYALNEELISSTCKEVNKENEDSLEVKSAQKQVSKVQNKNSYLTVNIDKVDMLMNLVGEIVTTESMVEKQAQIANIKSENFEKQARRLHQLTNELQDVVMSIRMVPISSTFTKMQRVVRDMSKKTGKLVDLVLVGEETEVDKSIIENISDPLMHMIRNSMDHGIETKEERIKTLKPEKATITLEAKNTGGDVVIVIRDDGRGLDKEAIVKKAIEKGITNKNIEDISDKEAYNFILAPGFSTKESVSEFSGRGVGMDVVYTNIRKLRGTITINSDKGKGTMFVLRIPLTLAIINGMKVKIANETYIIPSLSIKEVFRHGTYEIVQNLNGEEHSIVRGNCYQVNRLSNIVGINSEKNDKEIMILVESEMGSVCVIVDDILGQQQVVIKSIPKLLTQFEKVQSYISGCSILEDGSISLIFDVNALIN